MDEPRRIPGDRTPGYSRGADWVQQPLGLYVPKGGDLDPEAIVRRNPRSNPAERSQASATWFAVATSIVAILVAITGNSIGVASLRTQVSEFYRQVQADEDKKIEAAAANAANVKWWTDVNTFTVANRGRSPVFRAYFVDDADPENRLNVESFDIVLPPCTQVVGHMNEPGWIQELWFMNSNGIWSVDLLGAVEQMKDEDAVMAYAQVAVTMDRSPRDPPALALTPIGNC